MACGMAWTPTTPPMLSKPTLRSGLRCARIARIEAITLSPTLDDFNEDLRTLGIDALRAALRVQIAPEDVARFMELAASTGTER